MVALSPSLRLPAPNLVHLFILLLRKVASPFPLFIRPAVRKLLDFSPPLNPLALLVRPQSFHADIFSPSQSGIKLRAVSFVYVCRPQALHFSSCNSTSPEFDTPIHSCANDEAIFLAFPFKRALPLPTKSPFSFFLWLRPVSDCRPCIQRLQTLIHPSPTKRRASLWPLPRHSSTLSPLV